MKTVSNAVFAGLLVCFCLAVAGHAVAQAPDAGRGNRSGPPAPEQQIRRLDRDGDGRISHGEAPEYVLQRWKQLDLDGDGFLTRQELQARNDRVRGRSGPQGNQRSAGDEPPHAVGLLIHEPEAFEGYTLFAPISSTTTYLIDNDGKVVNSWQSDHRPGHSVYLLENGHLLRTADVGPANRTFRAGGSGGRVEEFRWDGTRVWEFEYATDRHLPHHDIEPLPNGNVLMIAWEYKTADEAIAAGRDPSLLEANALWTDHLIEIKPTRPSGGEIVWQWHGWDHVIQAHDPTKANYGKVADHAELLDIDYSPRRGHRPGNADWTHFNSIDYNPELDQILVSCHGTSEIFVIDHSTTTAEARGHAGGRSRKGGDILYRWGNSAAYRAGTAADQKLFAQHDAQWIEPGLPGAGHILVFNNGQGRPDGPYSSVEEIVPPVDDNGRYALTTGRAYGPAHAHWTYTADNPTDFFSSHISGAQRLGNGNTLACCGAKGWFFEVTPAGKLVWQYVSPVAGQPPGGPGMGGPGVRGPGMQGPGMGGPGMRRPGMGGPGMGGPSMRRPGTRGPDMGGPGMGGPGIGPLGMGPPGMGGPPAPSGPMRDVFRSVRYAPDYPGLAGKDLTPVRSVEELVADVAATQVPPGLPPQPGLTQANARQPAARDLLEKPPWGTARFYVRADQTAQSADGESWQTAFPTVQQGIDAAERAGGGQVWVTGGTYMPTGGDDQNASFRLKPGVEVYGGFVGTETRLDQRDWKKNATILSGDIGRPGDPSDNVFHVVTGTDHSVLDGFTVTGGNGMALRGARRRGAQSSGPPQGPRLPLGANERSNTGVAFGMARQPGARRQPGVDTQRGIGPGGFGGRPFGGAASAGSDRPIHITPQIVLRGVSPGQGAGMINYQCAPIVRNCIFRENRAHKGGGMYNLVTRSFPPGRDGSQTPQPQVINCKFIKNYAVGRGGGQRR